MSSLSARFLINTQIEEVTTGKANKIRNSQVSKEKTRLLERGYGVEKEVDPRKLSGSRLLGVVGGESERNCAGPIIGIDWRRQQRKWHQLTGALHALSSLLNQLFLRPELLVH